MPEIIDRFKGKYSFLSNFAISPFNITLYNGEMRQALTVEHAFQACKASLAQDAERIITASTARAAKQIGRQVPMIPDWDTRRISIMHTLLKAKFAHPLYRQLLLNTRDAYLIEGNTWGDDFWGMCPNGQQGSIFEGVFNTITGYNWLGTLLMLVRSELA